MFNFFNQRRAWDDLIIVFLKCGCSGAGLTLSAAMAMTLVAWKIFRRESAEESSDRALPSATTKDLPHLAAVRPNASSIETPNGSQIPASLNQL